MDCVVTYQRMRPISVCACCDRPIPEQEGVTVVFHRSERVEDYCLACFDGTLLVRRS